jgi:pyrimidine-nucleoside phosphorylase
VSLIAAKRDGEQLRDAQIEQLIDAYVAGAVPDYQMSALLMAIVFRGLDQRETLALTRAMVQSGERVDMSPVGRRIVDKHSTGGVGDKVSLALAPIVGACGVPFGKMSGRGLGHTGGTLDKLESIPGYTVEIDQRRFIQQVRDIGVAVVGQTADIVPADKRLYALRDVTATVESIPLIAASIMSKKLAAGADAIVLDVKVGSGAFMKDIESARELADAMIDIGAGAGRDVKVLITDMSAPLGKAIGNALEINEVIRVLEGDGPSDVRELVLTAAGVLLALSDLGVDEDEGRARAEQAVADGSARAMWHTWIAAQGGDSKAPLPVAPVQRTILASQSGVVNAMDALTVGQAAAHLGAGRQTKDDAIDHAVGVELHAQIGETIGSGEPLFTVHARTEQAAYDAATVIENATTIGQGPARTRNVLLERRG